MLNFLLCVASLADPRLFAPLPAEVGPGKRTLVTRPSAPALHSGSEIPGAHQSGGAAALLPPILLCFLAAAAWPKASAGEKNGPLSAGWSASPGKRALLWMKANEGWVMPTGAKIISDQEVIAAVEEAERLCAQAAEARELANGDVDLSLFGASKAKTTAPDSEVIALEKRAEKLEALAQGASNYAGELLTLYEKQSAWSLGGATRSEMAP